MLWKQWDILMKQYKKLVSPYCFWLFVLTIVPMMLIAFYALTAKGTEITTFKFTFDNFFKIFRSYLCFCFDEIIDSRYLDDCCLFF